MNHLIRYESAGNQYVGCYGLGDDRLKNDFDLSNPYFDCISLDEVERDHARVE